jgi:pilus assembly protein CpaD
MTARARKDSTMSRLFKFAAGSALALAAGGCATQPRQLSPHNNTSVYSLHQPIVEHSNFVFDVSTDSSGVSAAEQARLAAWFESIELAYGDHVTVDEPAGHESGAARHDVALVAARYGLIVDNDGASPVTQGHVAPGSIRIVASRSTASVPGCPSWTDPGIDSPLRLSTNYGCATNTNLAAMVANPDDLVHGREASGAGAVVVAGRAIRTYRESQPTSRQGLPASTTTGR